MKIREKFLLSLIAVGILSGCAAQAPHTDLMSLKSDGLISITRLAPEISKTQTTLLGFIPVDAERQGKWLSIDAQSGTVSLMDGERVVAATQSEGLVKVKPGTYHLLHKQRSPLWYANNEYFTQRSLPIPGNGDRSRYRRGALGDFALFLDRDTPIHSSPVWTDEVGGLRISEEDIKKIYYSVDIGSLIEIK